MCNVVIINDGFIVVFLFLVHLYTMILYIYSSFCNEYLLPLNLVRVGDK
jgi:hypothetical protein